MQNSPVCVSARRVNMSVKYFYILILASICVAHVESDSADRNCDRVLEAQIKKLNAKLSNGESIAGFTFLVVDIVYQRFAPDNYNTSEDYIAMQTFVGDVLNRTREHYEDVVKQARATGVLKYSSPILYIMNLADEGRENIVEPVKRAILGPNEFEKTMKAQCADLWTDVVDTHLETFRQLSKIQEANPEEFFIIEDAKGLDRIHTPMPADSSPEVLNVSEKIKAIMDELGERREQLEARFKRLNIKRKDRQGARTAG